MIIGRAVENKTLRILINNQEIEQVKHYKIQSDGKEDLEIKCLTAAAKRSIH